MWDLFFFLLLVWPAFLPWSLCKAWSCPWIRHQIPCFDSFRCFPRIGKLLNWTKNKMTPRRIRLSSSCHLDPCGLLFFLVSRFIFLISRFFLRPSSCERYTVFPSLLTPDTNRNGLLSPDQYPLFRWLSSVVFFQVDSVTGHWLHRDHFLFSSYLSNHRTKVGRPLSHTQKSCEVQCSTRRRGKERIDRRGQEKTKTSTISLHTNCLNCESSSTFFLSFFFSFLIHLYLFFPPSCLAISTANCRTYRFGLASESKRPISFTVDVSEKLVRYLTDSK